MYFRKRKRGWPSGYILRVNPDGAWELLSAAYKQPAATLASGSATIDRHHWHRLELKFRGTQIAVSLDDKPLAMIESTAHTHGMFAVGTEWDHTQFDNVRVTP